MTAADSAGPAGPDVVVLGREGLLYDLALRTLRTADVTVTTEVELEGPPNEGSTVVLVHPEPRHWKIASLARARIVYVTELDLSEEGVIRIVLGGTSAILGAGTPLTMLPDVVHAVTDGESWFEPSHARTVTELASIITHEDGPPGLSTRQHQILEALAAGRTLKATARELGLSVKTVENTQSALFRKLGARNRAQAVARAHALGLLRGRRPDA